MNTYYIELPKSDCGQSEVIKTTASSKKSAFEFIEDIYKCPKSSLRCLKSSCKVNRFKVIINDDNTGYFEHDELGELGGLWFSSGELYDYDGVYELPKSVIKAIKSLNYKLEI